MKTELLLDYQTILANQSRPIHFALRFTADPVKLKDRQPLAFCIVLDRSGSMAGEPLHRALLATRTAIRNLRTEDQFSLVVFDCTAQTVKHQVSMSVVTQLAKAAQVELRGRGAEILKEPPARVQAILLEAWTNTLVATATKYHVSKQYVGQLIKRWDKWTSGQLGPRDCKTKRPKHQEARPPKLIRPHVITFRVSDAELIQLRAQVCASLEPWVFRRQEWLSYSRN